MSDSSTAPAYRAALALPGAAYAFTIAIFGRLAYGVITLPMLFSIQAATDSFSIAGVALGAFGVATLTAPIKSRLMDRLGQPRVLGALGSVFPIPLLVLAIWGDDVAESSVTIVALATLAGLLTPPLGPAMRFLWSQLTPDSALKQRAYALDSIVEETLYTIGPAIAGGIITLGRPDAALMLTAVMALVGTVGLATSPACRIHGVPRRSQEAASRLGPLRVAAFYPLLVAVLGVGSALGAVEVTVAAQASEAGVAGSAGYVLACLALGSVIGAAVWGNRHHSGRRSSHLAVLMCVFATGTALAAWAPNLIWLAVAVFVAGLGLSPVFVVAYLGSDDIVPDSHRTEATTWINTVNNLGWSGGAAVAGLVIGTGELSMSFLGGALVLLAAVVVVLLTRSLIDTPPSLSGTTGGSHPSSAPTHGEPPTT